MVNYFSQSKGQNLAKFVFLHIIFIKRFLYKKKEDITLVGTFGFFFVGCYSTVLIVSLLISFSKSFTIIK